MANNEYFGSMKTVKEMLLSCQKSLDAATLSFMKLINMNRLTGRKLGDERISYFSCVVCVNQYGPKLCVSMWLCMNLCICMCVMSHCVTRSLLSPSLHPDNSVKQGLI